jgi:3-hydroxybutyryl-CoA dehydrogenase
VSENLEVKQRIFRELAAETRPDTILATNTSSISITKIASSAVPQGESAASALGKRSAGRVVGKSKARQVLHAQTTDDQDSIFLTLSR